MRNVHIKVGAVGFRHGQMFVFAVKIYSMSSAFTEELCSESELYKWGCLQTLDMTFTEGRNLAYSLYKSSSLLEFSSLMAVAYVQPKGSHQAK